MADPLQLWRPHSVRFLVPTIEANWGIDGRCTCYLTTPYWTHVWIAEDGVTVVEPGQGRGVPIEFYDRIQGPPERDVYGGRSNATAWADMDGVRTVVEMEDSEWKDCRVPHGWPVFPNPCPVHGVGHERRPSPNWQYPEIDVGQGLRLGVNYELDFEVGNPSGGLWWY